MSKAWAIPTWLFLHTLAAQLPEARYSTLKHDLLYHLKNLCAVLPCPDCAQHASQYLAGVKIDHIPTKEAFKTVLWRFHNVVNLQTRKPVFPIESLDIYDRSNLRVMYTVFLREFTKPTRNPKLIMDVLARNRVISSFQQWMKQVVGL
jgi:hypothetical protein